MAGQDEDEDKPRARDASARAKPARPAAPNSAPRVKPRLDARRRHGAADDPLSATAPTAPTEPTPAAAPEETPARSDQGAARDGAEHPTTQDWPELSLQAHPAGTWPFEWPNDAWIREGRVDATAVADQDDLKPPPRLGDDKPRFDRDFLSRARPPHVTPSPSGPRVLLGSGGARDMDNAWIKRVAQMPPVQAARELWLGLRLSPSNEHLWTEQPQLRLREILALRNHLNPAALFAPRNPYESFDALVRAFAHVPGDPLGELNRQLEDLSGYGWAALRVPFLDLNAPSDVLDALVPRHVIHRLFDWCEEGDFPVIDFRPRDPRAGAEPAQPPDEAREHEHQHQLQEDGVRAGDEGRDEGRDQPRPVGHGRRCDQRYETPTLRIIDEVRAMFEQAIAWGCYVPDDPLTVPLVGNYLAKYYPELTDKAREMVIRAVRPPWFPAGSPGMKDGVKWPAFGYVVEDVPEPLWCCPAAWYRP